MWFYIRIVVKIRLTQIKHTVRDAINNVDFTNGNGCPQVLKTGYPYSPRFSSIYGAGINDGRHNNGD